jgi:hypothetical protein
MAATPSVSASSIPSPGQFILKRRLLIHPCWARYRARTAVATRNRSAEPCIAALAHFHVPNTQQINVRRRKCLKLQAFRYADVLGNHPTTTQHVSADGAGTEVLLGKCWVATQL